MLNAFRKGLMDAGFREGQNIAVDYRFAEGHYERLVPLATEFADSPIAVLVAAGGEPAARAAMTAMEKKPVVVIFGSDPIANRLIDSLSHPGHNLTGVSVLSTSIEPKRIGLMHDLFPKAKVFGALLNPSAPTYDEQLRDIVTSANAVGLDVKPFEAGNDTELETAFEAATRTEVPALLASADPFMLFRRDKIAELAAKTQIPVMYPYRDFPEAGGLMSYGIDLADAYRQLALYAARILKGDQAKDLPVVEPTKYELVINLKVVKTLGLPIPAGILALADEVIE